MSDAKWTPGPWAVDEGERGDFAICVQGAVICSRAQWRSNIEASIANAHLIAAAPDLYEALANCLDALMAEVHSEYDGVFSDEDFERIQAPYLAALAKARGEAA